jgi:hypothetical protein
MKKYEIYALTDDDLRWHIAAENGYHWWKWPTPRKGEAIPRCFGTANDVGHGWEPCDAPTDKIELGRRYWSDVPDWPMFVGIAFRLTTDIVAEWGGWWEMQYDGNLYHVKFHTEDGQFVMNGATLARAICRAWLLWRYRSKPEIKTDPE